MSEAPADPSRAFPVPVPDDDTRPFWEGCARRELWIQRCASCGRWLWQPRPLCSSCQTPDPVWTRVSGDGRVASWIALHPPTLPAYADRVPFVVLLVELEQGVRLLGYLVDESGDLLRTDGRGEGLEIGTPVALRFHEQGEVLLPSWTVASGAAR